MKIPKPVTRVLVALQLFRGKTTTKQHNGTSYLLSACCFSCRGVINHKLNSPNLLRIKQNGPPLCVFTYKSNILLLQCSKHGITEHMQLAKQICNSPCLFPNPQCTARALQRENKQQLRCLKGFAFLDTCAAEYQQTALNIKGVW